MNHLKKLFYVSAISLIGLLLQQSAVLGQSQEIEAAKKLYQQNRYSEAIELLERAIDDRNNNKSAKAIALRNLALVYQKLGRWQRAEEILSQAKKTIATIDNKAEKNRLLAQILEVRGQVELSLGRSQDALNSWKQAAAIYRQQGNITNYTQAKIYQASAMQTMGLYAQSIKTLTQVSDRLSDRPDNIIKAQALLSLGNVLTRIGEYENSAAVLNDSLAIAEGLGEGFLRGDILLNLGNNARSQNKLDEALEFYQQIANTEYQNLQLRAKLNRLDVLIALNKTKTALVEAKEIDRLIDSLPSQQTTIQGKVSLARYLIKLDAKPSRISSLLADAVKQARSLNIKRIEADALGVLGNLYEQNQQYPEAEQITERALLIAQSINAPELTYQWQWQLGRILKIQGQTNKAISAYTQATKNLQSLRSDLIAISSDVRYSFRQQIKPVYRELAALLLHPEASQADLDRGRQIIESLQVAELDNFFQEACLDVEPQSIEEIDPEAAVIYSIILQDRVAVILSQPGEPLQYHQTTIESPEQVDRTYDDLYANLSPFLATENPLQASQTFYNWLIRPLEDKLANQSNTLVFVLDGVMRGIPVAALHDGERYLIEKHSLALTPGLQLLASRSLTSDSFKTIAGGITESHQGFASLPNVKTEVAQIANLVPSEILLDREFTRDRLQSQIASLPYPVVHLATHGQFSSRAEDTFLLTWNDRINVKNLDKLLQNRDLTQNTPIELLILSACQTAAGDDRAALGLAGVAIRSGARSTVATLWSIQDDSTAQLISKFYQALQTPGISKAEALQQAQLSLLRSPQYQHPFYWSAFVLLGNWL